MTEKKNRSQAAISLQWCFHLADALSQCGVRKAFISPGSRSTPLMTALVHHPGIRCHSVLDERAASFMALGAGKASGSPALFICTSGTALANAYPAVVEARMSGSPLIVLSADRPPALRDIGSSQTIDQIKFFGDYPVFFFDTGEPVMTQTGEYFTVSQDARRLAHLAAQSVYFAVHKKGPVHINLPFRKPLEPSEKEISDCLDTYEFSSNSEQDGRTHAGKLIVPPGQKDNPVPVEITELLKQARRPIAIAGPGSEQEDAFWNWCQARAIPILCETGGVPGITHHPEILKDAKNPDPDLVFRTGSSPVHTVTIHALQKWRCPQIIFSDYGNLDDATLSSTHIVKGPASSYDWNCESTTGNNDNKYQSWHEFWQTAAEQISINNTVGGFGDPDVYRTLLPVIDNNGACRIVLSNSMPIRDYLLYGPAGQVTKLPVIYNRGGSGIDGVTSTAIGAALTDGIPTVLFTGDLAFLHDVSGLNNLALRDLSLKIVVVNNRGGNIFRMLPFEKRGDVFTNFVETPQQVSIPDVARAHGLPFEVAETEDQIRNAWEKLSAHPSGILECRTDADVSMKKRGF